MRNLLVLGFVCALLLSGCIQLPGTSGNSQANGTIPSNAGAGNNAYPTIALPTSAQTGITAAKAILPSYINDSVLVSVGGSCDRSGLSSGWQYTYESYNQKKDFIVMVSDTPSWRDASFSFSSGLPDNWIDSADAASVCNSGGECTLEMENGAPVWNIIDGQKVCTVDAIQGKVVG